MRPKFEPVGGSSRRSAKPLSIEQADIGTAGVRHEIEGAKADSDAGREDPTAVQVTVVALSAKHSFCTEVSRTCADPFSGRFQNWLIGMKNWYESKPR